MFDEFVITEKYKRQLCNNILPSDLLGIHLESEYPLYQHPYYLLSKMYSLPPVEFTLKESKVVSFRDTLFWNKVKKYVPNIPEQIFSFEWKKEWNNFYKLCKDSPNLYLKQQNVYPQIVDNKIIYTPILRYKNEPINLNEEVKQLYKNEDLINRFSKILFNTFTFNISKDLECSFMIYLQSYFRIVSIQNCRLDNNRINFNGLTEFERNQLEHQLKEIDITLLKQLGLKTEEELDMILEANMVNNSENLLDSIWEFKWKVVINNNVYTEEEFLQLVKETKNLPVNVNKVIKKMREPRKLSHSELYRSYLLNEIQINNGKNFLENLNRKQDFLIKENIKTELRSYQKTGYNWMLSNLLNGFGVLLADEMGLGKTLQVLSVIAYLNVKVVILCPSILQLNWLNEIKKHTTLTGSLIDNLQSNIIITSYETFLSRQDKLNLKFDLLVLDEAQKIKNSNTKLWKKINSLNVKYRILITGTPVENNLTDLWSLMQIVFPGFLGKKSSLNKEHINKIISPFILRRKKKDCLEELPPKIETVQLLDLTIDQAVMYKKCLDQFTFNNTTLNKFTLATKLKMICNHPAVYTNESQVNILQSNKCTFVKDFIDNTTDKTVIFTQFVVMGKILKKMLNAPFISGDDSIYVREDKIKDFQTNVNTKVIIISLRTGNTGITLTSASNVIIFDLWWNPAVIEQAIDRTHRIGQDKIVNIYTLITKGTLEEKIYALLQSKKKLSDEILETTETWISQMTNEEIKQLFGLTHT